MQKKELACMFELQKMVVDLALIDRNHYLAGQDRRENDIEHSFSVALLCWYILDANKLDLDVAKVLKYALSHDFVERYAGDVNTYASADARKDKIAKEAASLIRLSEEFCDFPDLIVSMGNYESKVDEEALFVWTVDKMQQLVMGDLDSWRPYSEISISYQQFIDKNHEQLSKSSIYAKEIFSSLIEYCLNTYYTK